MVVLRSLTAPPTRRPTRSTCPLPVSATVATRTQGIGSIPNLPNKPIVISKVGTIFSKRNFGSQNHSVRVSISSGGKTYIIEGQRPSPNRPLLVGGIAFFESFDQKNSPNSLKGFNLKEPCTLEEAINLPIDESDLMVGKLQKLPDSHELFVNFKGKKIFLDSSPHRKSFTPIPGVDCLFSLYNKKGTTAIAHLRVMANTDKRRSFYNVIPPESLQPLVNNKGISLVIEDHPEGVGHTCNIPTLNARDLSEIGGSLRSLDWSKVLQKAISKYKTNASLSSLLDSTELNILVLPSNCGGKSTWNNLNKLQFLSNGPLCKELNSVWIAHPIRSGSNAANFNVVNKNFDFCRTINPLVKEIITTEKSLTLLNYKNGLSLAGNKAQFAVVEYTYCDEIPDGNDLSTQPPTTSLSSLTQSDRLNISSHLTQIQKLRLDRMVKVAVYSPGHDPTKSHESMKIIDDLVSNSKGRVLLQTLDGTRAENFVSNDLHLNDPSDANILTDSINSQGPSMLAMKAVDFLSNAANVHNVHFTDYEDVRLIIKFLECSAAFPVGKFTLRVKNSLSKDEMFLRVQQLNSNFRKKFNKFAVRSIEYNDQIIWAVPRKPRDHGRARRVRSFSFSALLLGCDEGTLKEEALSVLQNKFKTPPDSIRSLHWCRDRFGKWAIRLTFKKKQELDHFLSLGIRKPDTLLDCLFAAGEEDLYSFGPNQAALSEGSSPKEVWFPIFNLPPRKSKEQDRKDDQTVDSWLKALNSPPPPRSGNTSIEVESLADGGGFQMVSRKSKRITLSRSCPTTSPELPSEEGSPTLSPLSSPNVPGNRTETDEGMNRVPSAIVLPGPFDLDSKHSDPVDTDTGMELSPPVSPEPQGDHAVTDGERAKLCAPSTPPTATELDSKSDEKVSHVHSTTPLSSPKSDEKASDSATSDLTQPPLNPISPPATASLKSSQPTLVGWFVHEKGNSTGIKPAELLPPAEGREVRKKRPRKSPPAKKTLFGDNPTVLIRLKKGSLIKDTLPNTNLTQKTPSWVSKTTSDDNQIDFLRVRVNEKLGNKPKPKKGGRKKLNWCRSVARASAKACAELSGSIELSKGDTSGKTVYHDLPAVPEHLSPDLQSPQKKSRTSASSTILPVPMENLDDVVISHDNLDKTNKALEVGREHLDPSLQI